ncbi:MAG: M20 family metallopeptidase [Planctomycetota bacterium]
MKTKDATSGVSAACDVVALLRELVAIPSVSGEEEAVRDHLLAWFAARGVPAQSHGRNVLVTLEGAPASDPARGLLLCSHYDVVPVGPGWTRQPWDAALENGRVFGRGSNDAKSSVAAMAVTAVTLRDELREARAGAARTGDTPRLRGRLVLALVCDEETGGAGIEACGRDLPKTSACVVGEPTGLDVCPGQRGLLRASVTVRGRSCHASRPWEGINAIEGAAHDVLAIQGLSLPGEHPLLGRPTLQATVIAGGTRPNVIPGECVIQLDGRPTPECDNEHMLALLRAAVQGEVTVKSERFQPVVTPADAEIVTVARACSPTGVVRGFLGVSDFFHLRPMPGVVMGPGTSAASHAPDEWVAVNQVEAAATAYTAIARRYLAAAGGSTNTSPSGAGR